MKVTVSQTLSRTFNIEVLKGETLEEAFKKQFWDPDSLLKEFEKWLADYKKPDSLGIISKKIMNQWLSCRGWTVDDFEIIKE